MKNIIFGLLNNQCNYSLAGVEAVDFILPIQRYAVFRHLRFIDKSIKKLYACQGINNSNDGGIFISNKPVVKLHYSSSDIGACKSYTHDFVLCGSCTSRCCWWGVDSKGLFVEAFSLFLFYFLVIGSVFQFFLFLFWL